MSIDPSLKSRDECARSQRHIAPNRRPSLAKSFVVVLLVLIFISPAVMTPGKPGSKISGKISGLELCLQSICGSAVFGGRLQGGRASRNGSWLISINHDPLPDPGESSAITGGDVKIKVGKRRLRGEVLEGTIANKGNDTFKVTMLIKLTRGGKGELIFRGRLDHRSLPFKITGTLS